MKPVDLDVISTIFKLANPHATASVIKAWTLPILEKHPTLCWVIEQNNTLVGGITAYLKASSIGHISDLAVLPSYQGQGLGKQLIHHIIKQLKKLDSFHISLDVHYLNAGSIPFYYRCGFRLKKILWDYFGEEQDAILLTLKGTKEQDGLQN